MLGLTREQRFHVDHFCENATDTPNIDRGGVVLGSEEDIRSSVPESNDFISIVLYGDTEGSRQTKVRQFQNSLLLISLRNWLVGPLTFETRRF